MSEMPYSLGKFQAGLNGSFCLDNFTCSASNMCEFNIMLLTFLSISLLVCLSFKVCGRPSCNSTVFVITLAWVKPSNNTLLS